MGSASVVVACSAYQYREANQRFVVVVGVLFCWCCGGAVAAAEEEEVVVVEAAAAAVVVVAAAAAAARWPRSGDGAAIGCESDPAQLSSSRPCRSTVLDRCAGSQANPAVSDLEKNHGMLVCLLGARHSGRDGWCASVLAVARVVVAAGRQL